MGSTDDMLWLLLIILILNLLIAVAVGFLFIHFFGENQDYVSRAIQYDREAAEAHMKNPHSYQVGYLAGKAAGIREIL